MYVNGEEGRFLYTVKKQSSNNISNEILAVKTDISYSTVGVSFINLYDLY